MTAGQKTGWFVVIFLASLTSLAAIGRVITIQTGMHPPQPSDVGESFDVRYSQNPALTYVHVVPGLVFMILGPLQFSKRIRATSLKFHRRSGRVFLVISVTTAIAGMVLAFRLPAFGGLNTAVATYFAGSLFLFSVAKAYYHVRRGEIVLHREWIIRAFALGLGVSTMRLVLIVFILMHFRMQEAFGISSWLGFGTNLIAAEVWINLTRVRAHAVS